MICTLIIWCSPSYSMDFRGDSNLNRTILWCISMVTMTCATDAISVIWTLVWAAEHCGLQHCHAIDVVDIIGILSQLVVAYAVKGIHRSQLKRLHWIGVLCSTEPKASNKYIKWYPSASIRRLDGKKNTRNIFLIFTSLYISIQSSSS